MKKRYGMAIALLSLAAPLLTAGPQAPTTEKPATTAPPAAAEKPARVKEPPPTPTLWAASELKWTDIAAIKGARQAVLWGDPEKEGFGKLNRWPAGTEVPLHFHPFEVRGLVLEGTITLTVEGGAAKELGAGSYWHMPGRVKHVTTCKPGADCQFLTTSKLRYETRFASAAAK